VRGLGERCLEEARETLALAVERHHPSLVLACSFQKEESVLVDLLADIEPEARVFTIDTGVLFPETLSTWRAFEERWDLKVEVHDALGDWSAANCCSAAKVAALERALTGVDAWVTGVRRAQSSTRAEVKPVDWDRARSIAKYSPLASWTDEDVWRYVHEHELPYNPLHDRGYDSIGCQPCTLPGSGREGRWAGTDKTECGLHVA
jgi:phosphoadenosine phosphosulfate reductase